MTGMHCGVHLAPPIVLSPEERSTLTAWAHAKSLPLRLVQRAQIITLAADGMLSQDIARPLRISRPTVQLWRERFLGLRVAGLEHDAPSPGRIPRIPAQTVRRIIEATLHTTPPAATHWSTRTMADAHGVSEATVRRIWKQHGLKPHRIKTFNLSRDTQFVEKLYDVVGLSLNPPDKSVVLSVDEKSQIQALDPTQPGLPMKTGRWGTRTHDYKRHGTTTLFAALTLFDGNVIGDCLPRHRHPEFIRFLKKIDAETPSHLELHLIVDNYGTHNHPCVKRWVRRHPRVHLPFIPTSSSWLNMVERWFRDLTDKRIRRGSFRNVRELIAAIHEYLHHHNQNPRVFTWTASADSILAKSAKCNEAVDALH